MIDERDIDNKALELIKNRSNNVQDVISNEVDNTNNVKEAIDLLATSTALKQQGVVGKLVDEKEKELVNDAEAKKYKSEAEKIRQEKVKELEEFDKAINYKKKEAEELQAEIDKAEAFFESNKEILSYCGIKSKKSLKVMQLFMIPSVIIFMVVQIIALPFTISGKILELIISIVGGICREITNNALKIVISILIILILVGVGFCAYYFCITKITLTT